MGIDSSLPGATNDDSIAAIFKRKKEFHRSQALLPIEEKIRILVELQKIAIKARPGKEQDDRRRQVWDIK